MTRTSWTGIGLTPWALLALLNTGCQPGASQSDRPAPLPTLGVEAASDVPHAPSPSPSPTATDEAMPAISPLDTLKQEAIQAEQTVDSGVQKTVGEVEQAALQPLPPPAAPAPDLTPAQPLPPPAAPAPDPTPAQPLPPPAAPAPAPAPDPTAAPAAVLDQGVQQVTDAVQQKADVIKQNIQQTADKLEKKVKKGYGRARDQIQSELAPKKP
jgi:hypothetical protein